MSAATKYAFSKETPMKVVTASPGSAKETVPDLAMRMLISSLNFYYDNIKVSRGEENLFIWCFFLAIVQLALDGADAYKWVKYIYVDDPRSEEHTSELQS